MVGTMKAWPVRSPRPVAAKLAADTPLLTGQVFKLCLRGFVVVEGIWICTSSLLSSRFFAVLYKLYFLGSMGVDK